MPFIQCIITNAPVSPVSANAMTIHPRRESLRPIAVSIPCTGNGVCVSHRT